MSGNHARFSSIGLRHGSGRDTARTGYGLISKPPAPVNGTSPVRLSLAFTSESRSGSLGTSFPGFGPLAPWPVTPDEFADPDDLGISCYLDGERMQHVRTGQMIFSVPELIERLSAVTPVLPGDVIFTGTSDGIGGAPAPARFLPDPGDTL